MGRNAGGTKRKRAKSLGKSGDGRRGREKKEQEKKKGNWRIGEKEARERRRGEETGEDRRDGEEKNKSYIPSSNTSWASSLQKTFIWTLSVYSDAQEEAGVRVVGGWRGSGAT